MTAPFMHWHGNPCWVSPFVPDGAIYTTPRSWDSPGSTSPGVHVQATYGTWSLLFALSIAKAYRPDGVP